MRQILTFAFVEAMRHIDYVVEYFKLVKNGKALNSKVAVMMEVIADPSKFSDNEISEFILTINAVQVEQRWNFFKSNSDLVVKQKLTGLMIRLNCAEEFCRKICAGLKPFEISFQKKKLNEILQPIFKPVIFVIHNSKKSKADRQIALFENISFEEFEMIKSHRFDLSRKMNKFESWSVNQSFEKWSFNRLRSSECMIERVEPTVEALLPVISVDQSTINNSAPESDLFRELEHIISINNY